MSEETSIEISEDIPIELTEEISIEIPLEISEEISAMSEEMSEERIIISHASLLTNNTIYVSKKLDSNRIKLLEMPCGEWVDVLDVDKKAANLFLKEQQNESKKALNTFVGTSPLFVNIRNIKEDDILEIIAEVTFYDVPYFLVKSKSHNLSFINTRKAFEKFPHKIVKFLKSSFI